MADPSKFELKSVTPRSMRPRSTPNAEINAQKGDEFRYDREVFERPVVKDVTPRGYSRGGSVKKHGSPAVTAPCKDSKTIKCY